jgi:uncharacterized protein YaaR (DUF327 family)
MDANKMLSEILGYYKQRVDNNLCTMAEMNDAIKALESNMQIHGTIQDFADYYGKSKDAVNSVIKRNLIAKPKKNITLYPFHAFRKVVPSGWRKK